MLKKLATMLAFSCCLTAHAVDNWQGLNAWHGKYPSDKLRGTTLLEQPNVKATLKAILPKAEQAMLAQLDVEAPVTEVAGFFTREEKRVATRWYGNADDYSSLPEAIKAQFLAKHAN